MGYRTKWTGSFPCLCHGEWKLYKNNIDISDKIPVSLKTSHMNTYGKYQNWYFDDDWDEVWESYSDGLSVTEWIDINKYWLQKITVDTAEQEEIYMAFQENDWRHGECGGCI